LTNFVTWTELTGGEGLGCAAIGATGIGEAVPRPMGYEESRGALDREEPPEAIRDMIRVWGVLNGYRPKGQTNWSRALVRHGADARPAIAAVLGVPAEQIGMRDYASPARS
jgi:hypothetical protein